VTRSTTSTREAETEDTVRIARKQFARRQWSRRWRSWRGAALLVVLLGLAGGLAWLFYVSSVLAVSGVTVEGGGPHTSDVRRVARVPYGTPLARVDLDAIAHRVRSLVVVEHVDVSRSWPDRVRIDVTQRTPVAVVAHGHGFTALDEHGVLFRHYRTRPAELPVVHLAAGTRSDAVTEAARVAAALPASIAARVDYVEVHTVDEITLHLHSGRTVLWGSADGSAAKAKVVTALLKHRATFYDVSSPGQPVLRR
jgi:cell division protein FtsQ